MKGRYVSPEEFRLLLLACDNLDARAATSLAYYAGLSFREIEALRQDSVVETRDGGRELRFFDAKTKQPRTVPISDDLWREMRRLFLRGRYPNGRLLMISSALFSTESRRLTGLAKIDRIPRLFASLRASRIRDLSNVQKKG